MNVLGKVSPMYTRMYRASEIVRDWKCPECPKQTIHNQLCYIHKTEYYTAVKMKQPTHFNMDKSQKDNTEKVT